MKPTEPSFIKNRITDFKRWLLYSVKGYKRDEVVAATCLCEGRREDVTSQEYEMKAIAARFGGIWGGSENGILGY